MEVESWEWAVEGREKDGGRDGGEKWVRRMEYASIREMPVHTHTHHHK